MTIATHQTTLGANERTSKGEFVRQPNAVCAHTRRHYDSTHPHINLARIDPKGPAIDWQASHGRGESGAE